MKNTKIKQKKTNNNEIYWLINDRWAIYSSDGCVYDTIKGEDIPQWVFGVRDELMKSKAEKIKELADLI